MKCTAEDVDRIVARNIRRLRKRTGVTQTALAAALNVTFQQVQKYERASNRVSAGRLYCIADFLGVDIGAMFTGLEIGSAMDPLQPLGRDALEAASLYHAVPSRAVRIAVIEMLRAVAVSGPSHMNANVECAAPAGDDTTSAD